MYTLWDEWNKSCHLFDSHRSRWQSVVLNCKSAEDSFMWGLGFSSLHLFGGVKSQYDLCSCGANFKGKIRQTLIWLLRLKPVQKGWQIGYNVETSIHLFSFVKILIILCLSANFTILVEWSEFSIHLYWGKQNSPSFSCNAVFDLCQNKSV